MIRKLGNWTLPAIAVLSLLTTASLAQSVLTHHVRPVVAKGQAKAIGRLPSNQVLQLDLVLPLRNEAGLKVFLRELSNPANPGYRQYLTPQQFTQRFGPTQEQYDTVLRFAKTYGFEVVGGSRDGMLVQVKGSVAIIEAAFHLNMVTFQHPTEDRVFYSADREPTLDLPFSLWHISGLDNFSIPHPLYEKRSDYARAHGISPEAVVSHATTGSGPSASFLGSDMRGAYATGTSLTGAGQNLGLFEYLGTDLADLNTYFTNAKQTNSVPITLLSTDGTSTSCVYSSGRCDDTEQTLDMTQAIGMAPGLASLVMYIGSTDTSIISAMTTHSPLPTTIGCSWGWTPADASTLDPYFEKMSAQGQNFFAASGDSSTWSKSVEAWPADDAHVISVGGTDLQTASAGGAWASETAWVDSGGGISPDSIPIPSWQQLSGVINSSNHGSTTLRNGPDVSANANFTFYTCADQQACLANSYGGTSFAAPMWAGFIALVNQQLVANGQARVSFLDPTLYADNITSSYSTNFHDITSGTSGSYSAVTGYDLVTGWGSPKPALIAALSGPPTPDFSISASTSSYTLNYGAGGTFTPNINTAALNGFTGTINLTDSYPSGWTVTLGSSSVSAGGSTSLSITVPTTAASGTYTITVTGTSGSLVHSTTVTVTVNPQATTFSITPTSTSITVTRGSTATKDVLKTALLSGPSGSVSFSSTGSPSRVTASFSPTSVTTGSSTTLSVSATRKATAGTFTLVVKGTGPSNSVTTDITVTVK